MDLRSFKAPLPPPTSDACGCIHWLVSSHTDACSLTLVILRLPNVSAVINHQRYYCSRCLFTRISTKESLVHMRLSSNQYHMSAKADSCSFNNDSCFPMVFQSHYQSPSSCVIMIHRFNTQSKWSRGNRVRTNCLFL